MVAMEMNFDLLPQCQDLYHLSLTAHPRGVEMRIHGVQNAFFFPVDMF